MRFAQLRRLTGPSASTDSFEHRFAGPRTRDRGRTTDRGRTKHQVPSPKDHQTSRLLALCLEKILVAIDAGQRRDVAMAPVGQQRRLEAGERGGNTHRRDGVTEVVLAVAERALPILPRLAPVD